MFYLLQQQPPPGKRQTNTSGLAIKNTSKGNNSSRSSSGGSPDGEASSYVLCQASTSAPLVRTSRAGRNVRSRLSLSPFQAGLFLRGPQKRSRSRADQSTRNGTPPAHSASTPPPRISFRSIPQHRYRGCCSGCPSSIDLVPERFPGSLEGFSNQDCHFRPGRLTARRRSGVPIPCSEASSRWRWCCVYCCHCRAGCPQRFRRHQMRCCRSCRRRHRCVTISRARSALRAASPRFRESKGAR